jgi:predicted acetyltransferase
MSTSQPLELVLPDERFRRSFLAAYEEMSGRFQSDWIYLGEDGTADFIYNRFPEYVRELRKREHEAPPHFVRGLTYWAVRGDEVLGRIGLRLELNDFLTHFGGHVGYIVRPSARGQGVATAMLRLVLMTPEAQLIGALLLTCDEDNPASERVIRANGGVFESTVFPPGNSIGKKRFWITL